MTTSACNEKDAGEGFEMGCRRSDSDYVISLKGLRTKHCPDHCPYSTHPNMCFSKGVPQPAWHSCWRGVLKLFQLGQGLVKVLFTVTLQGSHPHAASSLLAARTRRYWRQIGNGCMGKCLGNFQLCLVCLFVLCDRVTPRI